MGGRLIGKGGGGRAFDRRGRDGREYDRRGRGWEGV